MDQQEDTSILNKPTDYLIQLLDAIDAELRARLTRAHADALALSNAVREEKPAARVRKPRADKGAKRERDDRSVFDVAADIARKAQAKP